MENNNREKNRIKILIFAIALVFYSVSINVFANNNILLTPNVEQEQTQTVRGVITDSNGEPIIGATILEKGTTKGVATDENGRFSIDVQTGAVLVISYIGYETQEVVAQPNMNITLVDEAQLLDQLVVIGYGVQKKKLVTGATVQVKGEDISKLNTVDVLGALQSQSPGVNIIQNNGFLGQGFKVNIRGIGTNANASPLYVIDGVANASIDNLNPSDIESIDILKDAASAAIYGARAANGVILVTTKRGRSGVYSSSYDGYFGVQNLYKIPTILNAKEYMMMQDEGRVMDGLAPYNWSTYIPTQDLEAIEDGTWNGTNWLKEIQNKNAVIQNHSANFTGGSERSTYAIGLSYTNQESTLGVPGNFPTLDRYNFRVNSEHVAIKKNEKDFLKIGETINYKYSETLGSFGTGGIYWNGVHNMLIMSPLMHAYNPEGEYYVYEDRLADGYNWDISNNADKNPIAYLDYFMNQNKSKSHYLQSSFYAELHPIENLRIKSQFGYIMGASSYRAYTPTYELTSSLSSDVDRVIQSMSLFNRYSLENTANYIFSIEKNNFDVLIGQSIEKWGMGESISGTKVGSNFDDFEHAYLSNVATTSTSVDALSGSPHGQGALASFFGRVNYDYNETYMASLIMRYDGSSVFASGHRFGFFPSISGGWLLTNEQFLKDSNWLDFLKLRASWGQNGNNAVSTFQWLSLITSNNTWGGYSFGDSMDNISIGSYAYRLTNPDLTWETQQQVNIGVDARFLNNRLGVEVDWYNRLTKDWLVVAPVLHSFGANAPAVNGGDIKNTGLELGLHWNDELNKDIRYGFNVSASHNRNEVTKIANVDGIIHGPGSILWEGSDEAYRIEVGYPIGYFYGYKSEGVFQNQKQIDNHTGPLLNGDKTQPGDVIWTDVNNDGNIDVDDRTDIGSPHPDFTLGLSFNVAWKYLDFSVTTYGAFGQQIMKVYRDYSASPLNNYTTEVFKRWHGEGTSNKLPRLTSASSNNWTRVSDLYIENGDYLKIKNVTLGFDLKKAFNQLPLNQLRLYVTAQNLFTFTDYSGMDPEIGFGGEGAASYARGIDLGYFPSARNFMVGVNVQF